MTEVQSYINQLLRQEHEKNLFTKP